MTRAAFDRALRAAEGLHGLSRDLAEFTDWPGQAEYVERVPNPIAVAGDFVADAALVTASEYMEARDAFAGVAPEAMWRRTYRDEDIGAGFNRNFGCYELVGGNGHFACATYGGFIVYARPGLWYPWHDHPAEELYLVIAGEAEFLAEGRDPVRLGPGEAAFHASMQPHAMQTHDAPVLCYVAWRGDMTVKPKLTAGAA